MTALIPNDPESLEHTARAIGFIVKGVPGLRDAIYETIGLVWTDPIMRRRRIKNLKHEFEMAEEILKGQKRLDDVSAKVAKEVLEPAMEEDREELQKLWAALLARLLTGQLSSVRPEWIEIIKSLEEIDVAVLQVMPKITYVVTVGVDTQVKSFLNEIKLLWPSAEFAEDDVYFSFSALKKLGLIQKSNSTIEGRSNIVGSVSRTQMDYTLLGRKILQITSPPNVD